MSSNAAAATVPAESELVRQEHESASQVLDCGSVNVELIADDPAVVDFCVEYCAPWFQPTGRAPDWQVTVTSATRAYAGMRQGMPADATRQPCFAHDQQVLSLPAWRTGDAVEICDADRSCFLRLTHNRVDLIADPATRRWRFTLLWALQEIAATRLRQTHVDAHAASVEACGRGLVIAGPKNAGKTTLSFYLLRAGGWGSIANDRCFIGKTAAHLVVAGMPTAVKIRQPTLNQFPELQSGLPRVARPYLYSLAELADATPTAESLDDVGFFALTPNQVALRLGAETRAAAPLGAIVFPHVCADEALFEIEPLTPDEVVAGIEGNLYGASAGDRPTTFFEDLGGGYRSPSPSLIDAVARGVAGFRVRLGHGSYADGALSDRLSRLLTSG